MYHQVTHDYAIEIPISVSMHDTDSMGVVWHGNYLKYFERAREALLNKHHLNYTAMLNSGLCYPVVEEKINYRRFLCVTDNDVKIRAFIEEATTRLKIGYEAITSTGEIAAYGYTVQVAFDSRTKEMCYELPPIFKEEFPKCAL